MHIVHFPEMMRMTHYCDANDQMTVGISGLVICNIQTWSYNGMLIFITHINVLYHDNFRYRLLQPNEQISYRARIKQPNLMNIRKQYEDCIKIIMTIQEEDKGDKKRTQRKWRVKLFRKLGNCINESLTKLRKNQPFINRSKSQRRRHKTTIIIT